VFGSDTILAPLWISPLHDPVRMVLVALYGGIGFVTVTSLLAIYNRIVDGEFGAALFGEHGVAGIALYLAAVAAAYRFLTNRSVGFVGFLAIAIPLATLSVYAWREQRGRRAERALVVTIESVETVLNYAANTLSFLRVAAFSLNHVALALAVLSIAKTMGTTGHWITIVIGNVVVLVLEGAIVGIQALRLEYYEGFARFFHGDGRPFRALGIPLATRDR
jgi:V/A-type H+-transporting ATPase subunit I